MTDCFRSSSLLYPVAYDIWTGAVCVFSNLNLFWELWSGALRTWSYSIYTNTCLFFFTGMPSKKKRGSSYICIQVIVMSIFFVYNVFQEVVLHSRLPSFQINIVSVTKEAFYFTPFPRTNINDHCSFPPLFICSQDYHEKHKHLKSSLPPYAVSF